MQNFNHVFKIQGVDKDIYSQSFGRAIEGHKTIKKFCDTAQLEHIGCKGKATLKTVKEWIKENKPKEYYASWQKDSSHYKNDVVKIHIK